MAMMGELGEHNKLTVNSNVSVMCSINQDAACCAAWKRLSGLIIVSTDTFCIGLNAGTSLC